MMNRKYDLKNPVMEQEENEMKNSYVIGYTKHNIPAILYFNEDYLNDRLEFSINAKTWKVYFYSVPVGYVDEEGRIQLNEESDNE